MSGKSAMTENPYVGPRSFEAEDSENFFGRDSESATLEGIVMSSRASLLFAQSGAGKSSLVKAKLIKSLTKKRKPGRVRRDEVRQKMKVLPVATVGGAIPKGVKDEVANPYVFSALYALDKKADRAGLSKLTLTKGLEKYFAGQEEGGGTVAGRARTSITNTLLILDQFEELFTHHPTLWDQRREFLIQLSKALETYSELHVLIAMREDYIAEMTPFAHLLPNQLRERYRLERLKPDAALKAVRGPALGADLPFDEGVAEWLVDNLRRVQVSRSGAPADQQSGKEELGPYVEPVHLQIVCRQLWHNLPEGREQITAADVEDYGDPDEALTDFYKQTLSAAIKESGVRQRKIRAWFDNELITPAHTRGLVYRDKEETGGLPNSAVEVLNEAYIIRASRRGDDTWYELAHDRLVEPILTANMKWRTRGRDTLAQKAADWDGNEESPSLLLTGIALARAQKEIEVAPDDFTNLVKRFVDKSEKLELRRQEVESTQRLITSEPRKYLSETGWGIIFHARTNPAVLEALEPLINHRQSTASLKNESYFKVFKDKDGYREGESAEAFLSRHGVGAGKVDPEAMPYYLLIAGEPTQIPFEFQYQLGVDYAVGRIAFSTAREYRIYANNVIKAETGKRNLPRRLTVFSPSNQDDRLFSRMNSERLGLPVAERLTDQNPDWEIVWKAKNAAFKADLLRILGGDETPALLFSTGRGLRIREQDRHQIDHQGALVCQDWPGPTEWPGIMPEEFYYSAADITENTDAHGLITFAFNQFAAGTPRLDDFAHQAFTERAPIAQRAFVSNLPQRLMSLPDRGMLAMIGHVERSWTNSYLHGGAKTGVDTFAHVLSQLMDGYPVGAALEPLNHRYSNLATQLALELYEISQGKSSDPYELAEMWTTVTDARNWIILGDPAVRLMVQFQDPSLGDMEKVYEGERIVNQVAALAKQTRFQDAMDTYEQAKEANPWLASDSRAVVNQLAIRHLLRTARARASDGDLGGASDLLVKAVDFEPANRPMATSVLVEEGRVMARAGLVDDAIAAYQKALMLDPYLDALTLLTGVASDLARKSGVEKAYRSFEEAVDLVPGLDGTMLLSAMGRVMASIGSLDQAINALGIALVVDPTFDSMSYLRNIARTSVIFANDLDEAVAAFNMALQLDLGLDAEERQRAAQAINLMEEGKKSAQEGNIDQAMKRYQQALAIDQSSKQAIERIIAQLASKGLVETAYLAALKGEIEQAESFFEEALSMNPDLTLDPQIKARELAEFSRQVGSTRLLHFNGVNGASGEYDLPPMGHEEFFNFIMGNGNPETLSDYRYRFELTTRTRSHL